MDAAIPADVVRDGPRQPDRRWAAAGRRRTPPDAADVGVGTLGCAVLDFRVGYGEQAGSGPRGP
jgi:hypothetical protein